MRDVMPQPDIDRLLSAASVCQLLDTRDRTLRRWISDGRFPKADRTIGRALRWKMSTVRAWIEDDSNGKALKTHTLCGADRGVGKSEFDAPDSKPRIRC